MISDRTGPARPSTTRGWLMGGAVLGIAAVAGVLYAMSPLEPARAAAAPRPAAIDGKRAFGYLEQICKLGPRPAGSAANSRQRELVTAHFKKHGATIREQPFEGTHPETGERLALMNVIASWHPERPTRVLIAAHYDTRPHPDQEVSPDRYRQPFLGANDCASGVALMMEIAQHLTELPTSYGVDLVLLDAEELVFGQNGDYFLGSKAFARSYATDQRAGRLRYRYRAGILLDMVGGRNLAIKREPFSVKLAPWLVDEVWSIATQLGAKSFKRARGRDVLDDHLPLNDAGIPTIDIIDFDYPHWHLATDLPENCDPASLQEVGRVITAWIAQPPRPRR